MSHIIEPKLKRRTALTNISQESVAGVPSVQIQTCKPCLTIWSQGEYVQHSEKVPSPFKKYASYSTFTFHMSNLARHRFHVCPDRVQGPGSGSGADRACTWLPHLLQHTPIQFKSPRICSLGSIPLREIEVCLWAESRITRISIQWTMLDTGDPARGAR